jgi:hypothetical protein
MLSAASAAEYTFRIFVAMGPCSTSKSTSTLVTPPNTALTILAGSVSLVTLATVAPRMASHTVGTNIPT